MWRMLQHGCADDYALTINTDYTVTDFLRFSLGTVGMEWEDYVKYDERYERPTEVDSLIGDYSKAEGILKRKPKTFALSLAEILV
jgi:GDPmannose 4,6-dehydratase